MYCLSLYKTLLDKSSVAVRLIGSCLALDFSPHCPWFITITKQVQAESNIFLKYLPSVFPFGLIPHFSLCLFHFSALCLDTCASRPARCCGLWFGIQEEELRGPVRSQAAPQGPWRELGFPQGCSSVSLVVLADLVSQRASRVVKKCF